MISRLILISVLFFTFSFAQTDESKVYKNYSINRFVEILKPYQSGDYAVGIQAKGKLANVLTNFGELSSFHVYAPSLEWPAFGEGQKDQQQYGWGVNLLMGYNGDVVESFKDPASNLISREWQPANEYLFSGNVTVSETDLTPIMATSDNKETWPVDNNGNSYWPGLFRKDTTGTTFQGEFTSERDLYCVFTDEGNNKSYGLRAEQTAYSFSRRYAEDFLVYRYNIKNTSTTTMDSLYPGMMIQFLIDFDNHDLINFIDSNNDGSKDLIYMWDEDNTPRDPWLKVGYIGLLVIKSSFDKGITNFHYFHDDFMPSKDEDFWMILTSDTTGIPDTTKARFFHGNDVHIDDVSFAPGLDPDGNNKGGEISWGFSTGPVSLAAGDSMQFEIAIICGDDEQDLLDNVQWIWDLNATYWNGPNPPAPPIAKSYSGGQKVTIVWDAESSESSKDNVTGDNDFEGYKVYRSTDNGKTWGKKITDARGNFIGFEPIAQFDLNDGVQGFDPISNRYLGNDSGIKHTFVDTTVTNGIEYWYAVTAYDKGEPGKIESLESSLGLDTSEVNVVWASPSTLPKNYLQGSILEGNILQPDSGITESQVSIEIIDPTLLKNRNYKIIFRENTPVVEGIDTVDYITTFSLIDDDTDEFILFDHILTDSTGDNIPVVDGFRLSLNDIESGITFIGWTNVNGDTSTFDWYTEKRTDSDQEVEEVVGGFHDFKIVVVDSTEASRVVLTDGVFGHSFHSYINIPIKVYNITDPANPIDISNFTEVFDLRVQFPNSILLGPLGWDLIPGGAGYNPVPGVQEFWTDILAFSTDTLGFGSYVWLKTQNGPDSAIAPSVGDEFTILLFKPFNEKVVYTFSTTAGTFAKTTEEDLKKVKVVPNPFFVTSAIDDRIMFRNLPNQCDIIIYTVAGDKVKSLYHKDNSSIEYWNLKNDEGLEVAYGLYVYVVKTNNGEKHIGKFSVIR
jgi:hypothetical protein